MSFATVGTEITIEQEGVRDVIPLEAYYFGWQESLRKLARYGFIASVVSSNRTQPRLMVVDVGDDHHFVDASFGNERLQPVAYGRYGTDNRTRQHARTACAPSGGDQ